jgi:hypothetical protein
MKKSLLVLSMALLGFTANAQTRVENAENLPTSPLNTGFEFKFLGGRQDNCLSLVLPGTNDHWGNIFGTGDGSGGYTTGFQVDLDSNNHKLVIQSNGEGNLFAVRLPKGDCASMLGASVSDRIDLTDNQKISITLTSSQAVANFAIFPAVLHNDGFEYVDGHETDALVPQSIPANTEVTLTFYAPAKNWAGTTMPIDKMIGFALFARGESGTASIANTLTISSIKIGDAVTTVPASSKNANEVNDKVALYPNPAKSDFKLDMRAMNNTSAASVKVMNANGIIVKEFTTSSAIEEVATEGMNKGIYMVQVTSGNKIATKKLVVE